MVLQDFTRITAYALHTSGGNAATVLAGHKSQQGFCIRNMSFISICSSTSLLSVHQPSSVSKRRRRNGMEILGQNIFIHNIKLSMAMRHDDKRQLVGGWRQWNLNMLMWKNKVRVSKTHVSIRLFIAGESRLRLDSIWRPRIQLTPKWYIVYWFQGCTNIHGTFLQIKLYTHAFQYSPIQSTYFSTNVLFLDQKFVSLFSQTISLN